MGYMRHNAIVATSSDEDDLKQAHEAAKRIGLLVSDIVDGVVNGYSSFFIAPDGSKEGWPESEKGDKDRDAWITWLYVSDMYMVNWAEIEMPEDRDYTVTRSRRTNPTPSIIRDQEEG